VRQRLDRLGRAIGSWPRDLVVAIVAGVVLTPTLALLTEHKVRLWVLALAVFAAFVVGRAYATLVGAPGNGELESRTAR
jgi:predicted benzoate:H+ symporter BenE